MHPCAACLFRIGQSSDIKRHRSLFPNPKYGDLTWGRFIAGTWFDDSAQLFNCTDCGVTLLLDAEPPVGSGCWVDVTDRISSKP
jgi:hypothetical protein